MSAPVVNHFDTNIFLNSVIDAADMFSAFDPDGDTVTFLDVQDYRSEQDTGYFRLNGVALANGASFRITPAELADLQYVGGSRIGREGFRVIAYAGGESSPLTNNGFNYTVRSNTTKPFVIENSFSIVANEAVSLAEQIRGFDPDGYKITQYYIRDSKVDSNYMSLNGVALNQNQFYLIQSDEIANLEYNAFGQDSVEELVSFVWDGAMWSKRGAIPVTAILNANRPVAQLNRVDVISRDIIDLAEHLVVIDDDGNTTKSFEVRDTSPHLSHGHLLFNGTRLAKKVWHTFTAEEINSLKYEAPNRDLVQQIRFRGFDGKFTSGEATVSITTTYEDPPPPIVRPVLASDDFIYDEQLVAYSLDDLFARTDDGSETIRYQVYDSNSFVQRSARFELNNNALAGETIHEFSAAEAEASLRFRTGGFNDRYRDDLLVRAQSADGLWSGWEKLITRTEPEHFGAHDSGSTWNNFNVPVDSSGRMEFSYSFMQAFPDYETGNAADDDAPNNFGQFTQAARTSVRRVFDDFEAITNVKFVEVSDTSTNSFGGQGGIYRFGNYGNDFGDEAAFAFFPSSLPQGGDSWYDRFDLGQVFFDADDNYVAHIDPQLTPYTFGYFALVHELMHNFGFNHVFDDSSGSAVLPESTRNANFSVLVNGDAVRRDVVTTTPQLYDVESLHIEYGVNSNFNSGDNLYSLANFWNEQPLFSETLWDGGGIDTLSLAGSDPAVGNGAPNALDLTPGGFSSFNGLQDNVAIALRAEIENAIGSDLNDTIRGNHLNNVIDGGIGSDSIEGSSGDDTLTGGVGNDVFIFAVGDGSDVIDEQRLAGEDTIQLTQFPTLDVLEDDLTFRMDGRDLVIDLQLDNSGATDGSIRIVNQIWGRYQVETLVLNGIDIDLKDLSSQVTPNNEKFELTTGSSNFGRLAVPI